MVAVFPNDGRNGGVPQCTVRSTLRFVGPACGTNSVPLAKNELQEQRRAPRRSCLLASPRPAGSARV